MATFEGPRPLYEIDQLGFAAGARTILEPVSLTLDAGRIYGLVGANGSGKSTLVKLLARQQKPSAGGIRLIGRDIGDYADREFARAVAYMPQFTPPAESMTVRELVELGRFPWHGALGRFTEEDGRKVAQALSQAGLADFADRQVDRLSGGERQRAWLAMMLAQDARCMLLDEPTSALDIAHQVEMLALVRRLGHESGLCVVIVLHDINMAARICDEIIALGNGRVVARGTPDVILDTDVLARIYGLEMGILSHPSTGARLSYIL